jgi:hypothetical protein
MVTRMSNTEAEILQARIAEIDRRLSQIETRELQMAAGRVASERSYEWSELTTERNTLRAHRRMAEMKLRDLKATNAPHVDERREKFIEHEVAVRRQQTEEFIETLEAAGDYRQARIWRGELLNLRTQIEREFPA